MMIKMDKAEVGKVLEKYIEKMIPGTTAVATSEYNSYEIEVSVKEESKV